MKILVLMCLLWCVPMQANAFDLNLSKEEIAWHVLNVADFALTREGLRKDDVYEAGLLPLDSNTSDLELAGWCLGTSVLYHFAYKVTPPGTRWLFSTITIGSKLLVVGNNIKVVYEF